MRPRRWIPGIAATLLAALPKIALACPFCFGVGADGKNAAAFAATTTFLSALPLALVFSLVTYLRRRAQQLDDADSSAPPAP